MTISPIVGTMVQQSVSGPGAADLATSDIEAPLRDVSPAQGFGADTEPVPGTHAAPVSATEPTAPMRADLAPGETPGDDILAGLNKRWGNFTRALKMASDPSSRLEGDELDRDRVDRAVWSPVQDGSPEPYQAGHGAWSSADDGDYDRHADAMAAGGVPEANAAEGLQLQRAFDQGGLLEAALSKGIQAVESSIKTLVSGQ